MKGQEIDEKNSDYQYIFFPQGSSFRIVFPQDCAKALPEVFRTVVPMAKP